MMVSPLPPDSENAVVLDRRAPGRQSAEPMLKPPMTITKKAGASLPSGLSGGSSENDRPRLDRSMLPVPFSSCNGSSRRISPISTCHRFDSIISDNNKTGQDRTSPQPACQDCILKGCNACNASSSGSISSYDSNRRQAFTC